MVAVAVPVAASQGCGDSGTTNAKGGCTKDTDCKGDRICVAGECVSASGDSGTAGAGGSSIGTGGANSSGSAGRSSGGRSGAGGSADSGTSGAAGGKAMGGASGAAGAGGRAAGGTSGAAGAGGRTGGAGGADAAPPGPECTQQDTSACPPGFPFPACCTRAGSCGTLIGALGCVANGPTPDAGAGAGGATGGGGLVSAACKSCRSTNCDKQLAACNANTACAALSSCIDDASPFSILNCGITTVSQPVRTLYDALSTCASTNCAGCPNINL